MQAANSYSAGQPSCTKSGSRSHIADTTKHSAYLIANSDMPGFSSRDQHVVASIVRSHRRSLKTRTTRRRQRLFDKNDSAPNASLSLGGTRQPRASRSGCGPLTAWADESILQLSLGKRWLSEHPLYQADLQSEVTHFRNIGIELVIN